MSTRTPEESGAEISQVLVVGIGQTPAHREPASNDSGQASSEMCHEQAKRHGGEDLRPAGDACGVNGSEQQGQAQICSSNHTEQRQQQQQQQQQPDQHTQPVSHARPQKYCAVCGDKAIACNFNAVTCESCKAFFRRNAFKEQRLRCLFESACVIDRVTRRFCSKCRLLKCFAIGMRREWILTDEQKQIKRVKIMQNKQARDGRPQQQQQLGHALGQVTPPSTQLTDYESGSEGTLSVAARPITSATTSPLGDHHPRQLQHNGSPTAASFNYRQHPKKRRFTDCDTDKLPRTGQAPTVETRDAATNCPDEADFQGAERPLACCTLAHLCHFCSLRIAPAGSPQRPGPQHGKNIPYDHTGAPPLGAHQQTRSPMVQHHLAHPSGQFRGQAQAPPGGYSAHVEEGQPYYPQSPAVVHNVGSPMGSLAYATTTATTNTTTTTASATNHRTASEPSSPACCFRLSSWSARDNPGVCQAHQPAAVATTTDSVATPACVGVAAPSLHLMESANQVACATNPAPASAHLVAQHADIVETGPEAEGDQGEEEDDEEGEEEEEDEDEDEEEEEEEEQEEEEEEEEEDVGRDEANATASTVACAADEPQGARETTPTTATATAATDEQQQQREQQPQTMATLEANGPLLEWRGEMYCAPAASEHVTLERIQRLGFSDSERRLVNEMLEATRLVFEPQDPHTNNDSRLDDIVFFCDAALRRLIKTVKQITAFRLLSMDDQIVLLKNACFKILLLRSSYHYHDDIEGWRDRSGRIMHLSSIKTEKCYSYERHKAIMDKLAVPLRKDRLLMAFMILIILFDPTVHLKHANSVSLDNMVYLCTLRKYLVGTQPDPLAKYERIVETLQVINACNEEYNLFFSRNYQPEEITPLLIEIFDISINDPM